jgi:alkylhydroperoxidase family enzyme
MEDSADIAAKVEATWNIDDPIFTPRERAALEMATLFTENYRDFSDEHLERWKAHFTDKEVVELATFMAVADGFGKVVEMFGLGDAEQVCEFEV